MPAFTLNKRQVNKLRKSHPALFEQVVDGKRVPIYEAEAGDILIIIPDSPTDTVEVICNSGLWLGDIRFEDAWKL